MKVEEAGVAGSPCSRPGHPAADGVTAENTWPGSSDPPGDKRQQLPARPHCKLTQALTHRGRRAGPRSCRDTVCESLHHTVVVFQGCVGQPARCGRGIEAAGGRPATSYCCPLARLQKERKTTRAAMACTQSTTTCVAGGRVSGGGHRIQARKEASGLAALQEERKEGSVAI